jgi:hypothetical protein
MSNPLGLPENINDDDIRYHILFSGHMIDKADRPTPRFPSSHESQAAEAIRDAIRDIAGHFPGVPMTGLASGACGGDILFHEACSAVGIDTILFLPKPEDEFIEGSVRFAGDMWVERYLQVKSRASEVHHLKADKAFPEWTRGEEKPSVYELTNLWMLKEALTRGGSHASLIALWDGDKGDGRGGTEQMVRIAKENGMGVKILDTKLLFH